MTVPKMMNTADGHITADGGDTGRLPQKIEKNFLIGLRETHPALPVLSADAVRAGAPVRRQTDDWCCAFRRRTAKRPCCAIFIARGTPAARTKRG